MSLNYFLHRAVASVRDSVWPEMHVFFEAPAGVRPEEELADLLVFAWNVRRDSVVAYNIWTEKELLTELAFGHVSTGDARLFETGWADGRVSYADPLRTQFFVSPLTHQRLLRAQALVVKELVSQECQRIGGAKASSARQAA